MLCLFHIWNKSMTRTTAMGTMFSEACWIVHRQLILDGQWEEVMQFIQPLEGMDTFDRKR